MVVRCRLPLFVAARVSPTRCALLLVRGTQGVGGQAVYLLCLACCASECRRLCCGRSSWPRVRSVGIARRGIFSLGCPLFGSVGQHLWPCGSGSVSYLSINRVPALELRAEGVWLLGGMYLGSNPLTHSCTLVYALVVLSGPYCVHFFRLRACFCPPVATTVPFAHLVKPCVQCLGTSGCSRSWSVVSTGLGMVCCPSWHLRSVRLLALQSTVWSLPLAFPADGCAAGK